MGFKTSSAADKVMVVSLRLCLPVEHTLAAVPHVPICFAHVVHALLYIWLKNHVVLADDVPVSDDWYNSQQDFVPLVSCRIRTVVVLFCSATNGIACSSVLSAWALFIFCR